MFGVIKIIGGDIMNDNDKIKKLKNDILESKKELRQLGVNMH